MNVKMPKVDYLHKEIRMLSVRQNNVLLTRQFLVSCRLITYNQHFPKEDPLFSTHPEGVSMQSFKYLKYHPT